MCVFVCVCVCVTIISSHTAPCAGRLLVCYILDLGSIARHFPGLCYIRLLLLNVRKTVFLQFLFWFVIIFLIEHQRFV